MATERLTNEDRLFYSPMQKKDREKILFLCLGNTCRSIIAEAVFSDKYKQHEVYSAGTQADGSPISENAKTVLEEYGLSPKKEASTHVSDYEDMRFDRVIILDETIKDKAGLRSDRTYRKPVEDPYGCDILKYKKTLLEIKDVIDGIDMEL